MNKKSFLVLALGAILTLAGCGGSGTSSTSSGPAVSSESTPTTSSTTSTTSITPVAVKLAKPVLALNAEKTGLSWAAVEHASKYQVKVGEGAYADATAYAFSTTVGSYSVSVKAVGDGVAYSDSDAAVWSYESIAVALSDFTRSGMTLSWTAAGAGVKDAFKADGNIASADWADTTSSSYAATASGKLGVVVSGGYVEASNKYYVGDPITKYGWVVNEATANKILINKDTQVADDIVAKAYDATGWVDAGAHAALSVGYPDIAETEKSIDFKIQQLSNSYKFIDAVSGLDAYKSVQVKVKGDGKSTLVLQMEGSAGYASYNVGVIGTNWTTVNIPFSDSGWKINGGATTLEEFAISQGFASAQAALYGFTSFDVVLKTVYDAGYAFTDVYINSIVLVADAAGATGSSAVAYTIAGNYTGKNSAGVIFSLSGSGAAFTFKTLNLKTNLSGALGLTTDGETATLKTADNGASLTFIGKIGNKGGSIAFTSATGTYASDLQGVNFNYVYTIDGFEGYSATGTGYDANNTDLSKVSGLRAAYYGEYYTGSSSGTSALGDKNWQMMGSADYLNLVTTEGHSGSQSASLKRGGNTMRYINSSLVLKNALPYLKGDTFSFWAKGTSSDVTIKVQPFTANNGLYWTSMTSFTLAANSGWTQYTLALDASKSYYGFGFNVANGSSTVYPEIDDLEIYTSANPWAVYSDNSPISSGSAMKGAVTGLSVVASFQDESKISVVATPTGSTAINMSGCYTVDSSNKITIDCGADLNYIGVLSSDKTAIKYTSATGTYAAYVANLFLEQDVVSSRTRVTGYENTTSAALQALYSVDETDSFTAVSDKTGYLEYDETVFDGGFASAKLKADVTATNANGKYRYRFASATSYGTVSNIAIRLKNAGSYSISGGVFYVTTASDSTKRANAGVSFTIAAGAGWTTFTGSFTAAALYGFSIYFNSTGTGTLAAATGSLYIDNVFVW